MPTPSLPNEIINLILGYLPLCDLYAASQLSRAWQIPAFPHLYNTVYLARAAHLESFAKRVASDNGHGPFSITKNLKGLTLDNKLEERYKEEAITPQIVDHLKAIIPRFHQLRRLCWSLPFTPDDKDIFPLFQTSCPTLESVDLSLGSTRLPTSPDEYRHLLKFTNLSHISFTATYRRFTSKVCLRRLAALITSSPNLESISIDLHEWDDPDQTYFLSSLVTTLGDEFTIPRLRTFRARGSYPEWTGFLDEGEGEFHPLHAFYARHPGIEDLALGWEHPDSLVGLEDIEPEDLAQLFPCLKHFEGPTYFCKPIISSSLASQLESLVVVDPTSDTSQGDWVVTDIALDDPALPRLRRLAVWAEGAEAVDVFALTKLTKAATAFEELEIRSTVDDFGDFLRLLRQLPHLRRLTLEKSILQTADEYYEEMGEDDEEDECEAEDAEEDEDEDNDGDKDEDNVEDHEEDQGEKDQDWEHFLLKLAKICPRLEVVRNFVGNHKYQAWKIVRGAKEELKVVRERGDR